jgi:hypothetical protein
LSFPQFSGEQCHAGLNFAFLRDNNCISSDLTDSVACCLKDHSAWLAYFVFMRDGINTIPLLSAS